MFHLTKIRKVIIILLLSLLITLNHLSLFKNITGKPKVFFGIEMAYGDLNEHLEIIDVVREYTNFYVIGNPEVTLNKTKLDIICDYLYNSGLYFIVFFLGPNKYSYNPYSWIDEARQRYGEKFLGIYRIDEPGGKQLDTIDSRFVTNATKYIEAASTFVYFLKVHLECYVRPNLLLFTSDYALYWFDYEAGYDVVLTQFGWGHNKHLHIALCRGAAKIHDKEWGVIVTWTYNHPPYIESPEELYNDLVLAYQSGAKYIVIFNYPKLSQYGVLTSRHLQVMRRFYEEFLKDSAKNTQLNDGINVAYVLPKGYGFGFRHANDTIWGIWKADVLANKIYEDIFWLLNFYESRLDLVYENADCLLKLKFLYDKIYFWNNYKRQLFGLVRYSYETSDNL